MNCSTPFSTVGKTSLTVPFRSASLRRRMTGMLVRNRAAWTSETVAVTRNDVRSAMRAMTSPRRTNAPSCDSTQVRTPSRSDLVVDRSRSRRACAASLSRDPRSSPSPSSWTPAAFWAFPRSCCSCVSSICPCFTASSERRSDSREMSPSLNSWTIGIEPGLRRLQFEALHFETAIQVDERLLERQPRAGSAGSP